MPYLSKDPPELAAECQACGYDCIFLPLIEGSFVDCPSCGARHRPGPDALLRPTPTTGVFLTVDRKREEKKNGLLQQLLRWLKE